MRAKVQPPLLVILAALVLACVDIPTGDEDLLSFRFDPLPSPSVVVGDTLRDSTGTVAPVSVTGFNFKGEVIQNPVVRYSALDKRIRIDSISGVVVGDSIGTGSRIVALVGGFTGLKTLPVVLRPDTVLGSNALDTLAYALADTTANTSSPMGVRLIHGPAAGDSAVGFFRVNFEMVRPADTTFVKLVDERGRYSTADTTDASGVATRRLRLNVLALASAVDSVIVLAAVRYRGSHVKGSPVRLVLHIRPR